jgi:hypothetical protein
MTNAERNSNDENRSDIGSRLGFRASSFIRHSSFVIRVLAALLLVLHAVPTSLAQKNVEKPVPLDPTQAKREAQELVSRMLSQRPAQDATNTGLLKIRGADEKEWEIRVRFSTRTTATNWSNIYEAMPAKDQPAMTLAIIHDQGTNVYLLWIGAGPDSTNSEPKKLAGDEMMKPFAGSDFWIADLGLEFLRWPGQRLLKKEVRRNKFCDVLESVNPSPTTNGYSRIVSWISHEEPHGIVHADAYDSKGKTLKRFDPTEFKKVEGQWQVESMEIRNLKTESRSVIEFNLK